MAGIELVNLSKRYGAVTAVQNISLEISDREFVVFVGPSGCGKTTTLRMIAGLERVTSGEIRIGGRVVNDASPARRNIAMVFQNYALYPHMTARENMSFGLEGRNLPRSVIRQKVDRAADILQISGLLSRKPSELSGGQKQRVALGRAIVRDPDVLLLDEPLSNLDAKLRTQMRYEMKQLTRDLGTTSIYVTHDQIEAMTLGDRIVVMNHGEVQQFDAPGRVYDAPANTFVAEVIGTPPMNLIPATFDRSAGCALMMHGVPYRLGDQAQSALSHWGFRGDKVLVGVRPEEVSVTTNARQDGETTAIPAVVEFVEHQGQDMVLVLRLGSLDARSQVVLARVESRHPAQEKGSVGLVLDLDRLRIFDPDSGNLIYASQ